MSVQHIAFSRSTTHGAQLGTALAQLEAGLNSANDLFAVMGLMLESGVAGPYMVAKFGFPDIATAQAAYDELNALLFKLNSDADVTFVHAALLQAFHKFG